MTLPLIFIWLLNVTRIWMFNTYQKDWIFYQAIEIPNENTTQQCSKLIGKTSLPLWLYKELISSFFVQTNVSFPPGVYFKVFLSLATPTPLITSCTHRPAHAFMHAARTSLSTVFPCRHHYSLELRRFVIASAADFYNFLAFHIGHWRALLSFNLLNKATFVQCIVARMITLK